MTRSSYPDRVKRIAILGGGAATRLHYIPVFLGRSKARSQFELSHVVDPDQGSLEKLRSIGCMGDLLQKSFQIFLSDDRLTQSIDAVIVALPHHLHEAAVCLSLEKGLHVLCEKPLALTASSANKMHEKSRQADRVLAVCHYRRHFPANRAIRDLIAAGKFGKCLSVDWREGGAYGWPVESLAQLRRENGGEVLYDIGAHVFEVITSWFDDCRVLSCEENSLGGAASSFDIELVAQDVPIHVSLSRNIHWGNSVRIKFEHGEIVWGTSTPNQFQVTDKTGPVYKCDWVLGDGTNLSVIDCFSAELENFIGATRHSSLPLVSGEGAVAYVSLLEQCERLRRPVSADPMPTLNITWPLRNRKISVTGASGFIGGRLAEIAAQQDVEVVAMARRPSSCIELLRRGMEPQIGNIFDLEYLRSSFRGSAAVFHCAVSWNSDDMESSVIDGTKNVLNAAVAEGVQSVVILGSIAAYGPPPPAGIIDEGSGVATSDLYGRSKARMLGEVESFQRKNQNMRVVVIEPTCVFGPRGQPFVKDPLEQISAGRFYLIEHGCGMFNGIYIDNLVDALLRAASRGGPSQLRYIVNEEEVTLSWYDYFSGLFGPKSLANVDSYDKDFLIHLARAKDQEPSLPRLLREAVRAYPPLASRVADHHLFRLYRRGREFLARASDNHAQSNLLQAKPRQIAASKPGYVPGELYINLFSTQARYSSQSFRKATGWRPQVPIDVSLQRTADWVRMTYPEW